MTLNSSGPISLAGTTAGVSIEIENGGNGTTQISLNCAAVRTLAGTSFTTPGSTIVMPTNFYGKANAFALTVASNQTNYCVRAAAVSGGWNQSSKLNVTINSGVVVSANSTGNYGLYIQGSFPNGVTLKNQGYIVGMGGSGGGGANQYPCNQPCNPPVGQNPGNPGGGGGTAFYVRSPVTVCNANGVIAGGGGGGGGSNSAGGGGGGGGGGRSGGTNSPGGPGGSGLFNGNAGPGGAGTFNGGGGGGGGTFAGAGGSGGGWGGSGNPGCTCGCTGGSGAGGGAATNGANTYVTWTTTGTRYGGIG